MTIPQHRGLALVRDTDAVDVDAGQTMLFHELAQHLHLRGQDIERVVLHPAGLGEMLRIGLLRDSTYVACSIDQQGTR